MAKLLFLDTDNEVEVPDGSPIKAACQENGIAFGCENGDCGTCMVTVVEGRDSLSPPNEKEETFFGSADRDVRLACQCRIESGHVSLYQ